MERKLQERMVGAGVLVLTESEREGQWKDKPVHLLSAESALLVKTPAGWRIRHFHWSSGPVRHGH